ncbi:MAG TPA: response regulator [Candidatus Lokiarchaeia archaeon]|nr:response regulator [Candidatus Lokiarchaeia archaeon]
MSILIVDDDEGIRESMSDILREKGFIVFKASNGLEALNLVESYTFDTILVDLRMPGLDGIETSKQIKKIQPDANIFMITAYISKEIYDDAKNAGIQEILSKPVNFQQLEKILA